MLRSADNTKTCRSYTGLIVGSDGVEPFYEKLILSHEIFVLIFY